MLIIGAGKMGTAIIEGLVRSGRSDLIVLETNVDTRAALHAKLPSITVLDEVTSADDVIVAVKPKDIEAALAIAKQCKAKRILSIVAGITLHNLYVLSGECASVVRAMPNLGATVGMSATAVCVAENTPSDVIEWARSVLGAIGSVVEVAEVQIDAVTGLSGSGPAYIFLVAEAMVEAGIRAGLTHNVAAQLVQSTIAASAELLHTSDAAKLREAVTTPGGTTAAGLRVLDERDFVGAIVDAVAAATARSRAMGSTAGA